MARLNYTNEQLRTLGKQIETLKNLEDDIAVKQAEIEVIVTNIGTIKQSIQSTFGIAVS